MGKKSDVGRTERRDAVLMLLRKEESAAILARRYGVCEATLYRWRDEFIAGGTAALGGKQPGDDGLRQENRELKREVEKREQVIGEITIANRILKKRVDGSI
jgi:transposase